MYERREREREFLRGAESFHRSPNRSDKAVYSCETGNLLRNTEDIKQFNMMEVVLTRLRDFSCRTSTFDENKQEEQDGCRDPQSRPHCLRGGCTAGGGGSKLDVESALAWLRMELMEMRSQDQALIRQLMELHAGIQELKQELSEEEEEENEDTDEEDDEEEEGSYWDSGSEEGSGSFCSTSGRMVVSFYYQKTPRRLHSREKVLSRRSSVP